LSRRRLVELALIAILLLAVFQAATAVYILLRIAN